MKNSRCRFEPNGQREKSDEAEACLCTALTIQQNAIWETHYALHRKLLTLWLQHLLWLPPLQRLLLLLQLLRCLLVL